MEADLIIQNGHVIDPANGINEVCDVALKDGIIACVGKSLKHASVTGDYFNAEGCMVTPGLIDAHIHAYEHCTPLGVNIDKFCLGRGSTTVVDAGSAGAGTFAGLRKFIAEQSKTRLLAFLHIAAHGMAAAGCAGFGAGGECDSINQVNADLCTRCIQDNLDLIVGVKVRLTADVCDNGKNEAEAFRRALSVCETTGLPLMTHHTFSSIPLQAENGALSCPGSMRAGDFYTHTFHGYPSTIIDPTTRQVLPAVNEARKRGVIFDIGHGQGSFSWTVAEECARQGFYPDLITTDLHSGNVDGPVYDLPTTLSKMLHLGMPLVEVIRAATENPAKALRKNSTIGSLGVGRCADITIMKLKDVDMKLEDSQAQVRELKKLLVPVGVWRRGEQYPITDIQIPNMWKWADLSKPWDQLVIRDSTRPL